MAQTAVDYFRDELVKKGFFVPKEIYTEAQEIFQEQIIDAFNDGDFLSTGSENDATRYYNETYNK